MREQRLVKIDEIKPYARNPRKNSSAVDKVAESIKEFGFNQPIVVDKNNVIIAGHTRYLASKQLRLQEVPVIVVDDLTDEQVKAYRLADNKVAEASEWDLPLLELELLDLDAEFMSRFGFDLEEDIAVESEKQANARRLEQMELKTFEHHDYIVFVFDNQMDWLNAVSEFDIHKVDAGYGTTKKIGVGRVVDGKRLLEKIQH